MPGTALLHPPLGFYLRLPQLCMGKTPILQQICLVPPQGSFDSCLGKAGAPRATCPQLSAVSPPGSHAAAGRKGTASLRRFPLGGLWGFFSPPLFSLLAYLSLIHLLRCNFSDVQGKQALQALPSKARLKSRHPVPGRQRSLQTGWTQCIRLTSSQAVTQCSSASHGARSGLLRTISI